MHALRYLSQCSLFLVFFFIFGPTLPYRTVPLVSFTWGDDDDDDDDSFVAPFAFLLSVAFLSWHA